MAEGWSRSFKPITLRDGRTIKTLDEARILILALPPHYQYRPPWQFAVELLLAAADRNEEKATTAARWQLMRALMVEGLL